MVLALGLPTTGLDVWNAQDVGNRGDGPGFPWTERISAGEQEALAWLERSTPPDAIVQFEPIAHGANGWTRLPSFASRRMYSGLPLSLLRPPVYDERVHRMRRVFATTDAAEAQRVANVAGIDFFYVGPIERAEYPREAVAKFDASPERFRRVFVNAEVSIYEIARLPNELLMYTSDQ